LFAAFFSLSIFAHFFFSDFWTNFGRIKNLAQYPSKYPNMYLPRIFKISGTVIAIWIQNCGFRYWISGKSIYTFLKQPAQITLYRAYSILSFICETFEVNNWGREYTYSWNWTAKFCFLKVRPIRQIKMQL
jgi:hypothetical protein